SQTIARSMADTGPMGGRYMRVGRHGKRPHSRMRRLQLRTVHDLVGSPRAVEPPGLTIDDGLRPGLVVVGADDGANVKLALLAGRDDVALAHELLALRFVSRADLAAASTLSQF